MPVSTVQDPCQPSSRWLLERQPPAQGRNPQSWGFFPGVEAALIRKDGLTRSADTGRPIAELPARETTVMERTWWESLARTRQPVETLKALLNEGRVRHVVVEDNRRAIADFCVTATDIATSCAVLAAVRRLASNVPTCTIHVELADLEAAHVAELLTTTP